MVGVVLVLLGVDPAHAWRFTVFSPVIVLTILGNIQTHNQSKAEVYKIYWYRQLQDGRIWCWIVDLTTSLLWRQARRTSAFSLRTKHETGLNYDHDHTVSKSCLQGMTGWTRMIRGLCAQPLRIICNWPHSLLPDNSRLGAYRRTQEIMAMAYCLRTLSCTLCFLDFFHLNQQSACLLNTMHPWANWSKHYFHFRGPRVPITLLGPRSRLRFPQLLLTSCYTDVSSTPIQPTFRVQWLQ